MSDTAANPDPMGDDGWTAPTERAAVIAWLRRRAEQKRYGYSTIATAAYAEAADAIEAGMHAREVADPLRQLHPPTVEMIAAVGEPDLTLGRFRVWPEGRKADAVEVEAYGMFGALGMGPDLFPDGDPWCAEEVPRG